MKHTAEVLFGAGVHPRLAHVCVLAVLRAGQHSQLHHVGAHGLARVSGGMNEEGESEDEMRRMKRRSG